MSNNREYYELWDNWKEVLGSFNESKIPEPKYVFAYYSYEDYGKALVVYGKNKNEFFVVEGSHCSCYGLEGQFDPTGPHSYEELVKMKNIGGTEYQEWLKYIETK